MDIVVWSQIITPVNNLILIVEFDIFRTPISYSGRPGFGVTYHTECPENFLVYCHSVKTFPGQHITPDHGQFFSYLQFRIYYPTVRHCIF